jgi:hypothetical protein
MSIVGGLDLYASLGTRFKGGDAPLGRKVIFLNDNGYDSQRERANKLFKKGEILTVKEIYVGRSHSDVEFLEYEGRFNTVMFADV